MPQMAAEIAKPLSSIDKVNIYGTGGANGTNGSGVSEISGNTAAVMQQVFDTMSEATGVDFRDILKAQTYDAKVNRNINVSGLTIPAVHREQTADPAAAEPESGTSDLSSGTGDSAIPSTPDAETVPENHTLVFLLVLHRPDDILLYLHSVLPVFANVLQGDSFFDLQQMTAIV